MQQNLFYFWRILLLSLSSFPNLIVFIKLSSRFKNIFNLFSTSSIKVFFQEFKSIFVVRRDKAANKTVTFSSYRFARYHLTLFGGKLLVEWIWYRREEIMLEVKAVKNVFLEASFKRILLARNSDIGTDSWSWRKRTKKKTLRLLHDKIISSKNVISNSFNRFALNEGRQAEFESFCSPSRLIPFH